MKLLADTKFEKLMQEKYENQFTRVPEFKILVDTMRAKNGFFAIWDDHDFAWDNAKGTKVSDKKKEISRRLFHKYLDCSTNLPHTYYHYDTELARVIFIDNRTDAEEKGTNSKLLSDEQFAFIEGKLNHNLKFTIICGGITLTEGNENWKGYPNDLKKLCKLAEGIENLFFLGGDIHKNRFVRPKFLKKINATTPIQLISSGMQVNYYGLGIPQDDKHNWAMLELKESNVKVSFFNKRGFQKKKSKKANEFLRNYIIKTKSH